MALLMDGREGTWVGGAKKKAEKSINKMPKSICEIASRKDPVCDCIINNNKKNKHK